MELVWNRENGLAFYQEENSSREIAFVIANGDILSEERERELIKNRNRVDRFVSLESRNISYFVYLHKIACPNLRKAGEDMSRFIEKIQGDYGYKKLYLVVFSKSTIAGYYAMVSMKYTENLHFIPGGAPWRGTELCDTEMLRNIPCRLPWPMVRAIQKKSLKMDLERDLSPNSESIRNIDFEKLKSIIFIQYYTMKEKFRSIKMSEMFPDSFVHWVYYGYFADGVIPIRSQRISDNVKYKIIDTTHCAALQKIVEDVCVCMNL